jgi:hypothetical protein
MPIRELPINTPNTEGKLFDRLQEMFGIGTWDESMAETLPYWKFRAQEIAKIKATRRKNDQSIADLYVAALWCKATSRDVRAASWLTRHVKDAWAWWDARSVAAGLEPTDTYAEAIRQEMSNPDQQWLSRLLRAAPASREDVYAHWLRRDRTPARPA